VFGSDCFGGVFDPLSGPFCCGFGFCFVSSVCLSGLLTPGLGSGAFCGLFICGLGLNFGLDLT